MRTRHTIVAVLAIAAALAAGAQEPTAEGTVNINTASSEQLQLLPRVGPALAERIIEFRDSNGPFSKPEEVVAVRGIGERSLEQLLPYVTVNGKTTLTTKVKVPRRKAAAS
jgi:competence protein ComEA